MASSVAALTQSEAKSLRIIRLMSYLDAGNHSSAPVIAHKFGVSVRTAERDIHIATQLLPLVERRGVLYGIWDDEED